MCDVCADFLHLLVTYEAKVNSNENGHPALLKSEIEIAFAYIQSWPQRQCMCCYRDTKNFERFNLIVQSMICLTVNYLKKIRKLLDDAKNTPSSNQQSNNVNNNNNQQENAGKIVGCPPEKSSKSEGGESKTVAAAQDDEVEQGEKWTLSEVEKLLILVSKAFLLNFPLYLAYKHGVHSRLDEISPEEAQSLSNICDLHDNEIPAFLLRNVTLFCNSGGFAAMTACFEHADLPVTTAHAITATTSNIKLWLNYRCIIQLFIPLRVRVLQYMCKLSDQDLRSPATRSMADFMWSAIRDPLESSNNFDVEGLALAFKYFNSTTLTMRLAGLAQINAHINLYNEICTTETVGEVEVVGQKLADWLSENQIISHLFGPNLHVEVIKQSHIVLNFLAVENKITEEHINLIWQSAQLKHCSKPIYDILPSLVKNLAPRPAMHLYSLLCHLDPKEHTEQSIYIASALTKLIWSRDRSRPQVEMPVENTVQQIATATSSENSVSIDGSNTEEEQPDDDSSTSQKSAIDIENGSDCGAPPCKQARNKECDIEEESKNKVHISEEVECVKLKEKAILPMKNRRVSNVEAGTSSEEEAIQSDGARKKMRKRRKNNNLPLTRLAHELVEAIWGVESPSEGDVGMNDSDCSDTQMQPSVLQPFISAFTDSHVSDLLSGGENDGSYSSPMSNKSEKNMADFDDDESACEEELAQFASRPNCLTHFTIPRTRPVPATRDSNVQHESESGKSGRNKVIEIVNVKDETHSSFKMSDVCLPGNTLLWDLLQDDKIGQLGESLALEAEKALGTLLCYSTDRLLRTKFIEGCLQNLASHKSVIVSLRLLPKLFASFQQFGTNDTHEITMWAERQHRMMHHFFNNVKYYANCVQSQNKGLILNQNGNLMYSHITQVQVRLQFLTSVFSTLGSPKCFRLSLQQVDDLWDWLANDLECADCLFAWLQVQAKGVDQHALVMETLQHLYLNKLPKLKPEGISMVALGLFQQLCSLARLAMFYEKQAEPAANIVGMNHLWKIALRAHNTEVSLAAIQYINSYYMGQQLKLEKEFVAQCMDHLIQAAEDLNNPECQENALMCVQRALMLLNTHLETFRRRYAYHLRRWALEGKGIGSHSNLRNETLGPPIRIILQPAGLSEKSILHLHANDLVADLKAEIAKCIDRWENLQGGAKQSGIAAPVLGLLLSEGPLRIITQGQELTSDYDERSLGDVGFKDNQIVYLSLSGRGTRRKDAQDHPSLQPPPPKECLPTVLLLQPKYFEELFRLMQTLGDMKMQGKLGNLQPHTKAQLLSRRVWDILAMLPTNPNLLESFKILGKDLLMAGDSLNEMEQKISRDKIKQKITELLDPNNLQKFMYSLHIVESLATRTKQIGCCGHDIVCKQTHLKASGRMTAGGLSKSNAMHSKKCASKKATDESSSEEKLNDDQKSSGSGKTGSERDESTTGTTESAEEKEHHKSSSEDRKELDLGNIKWSEIFISCGGMRHLFEIFMSGSLQNSNHPSANYSEWRHDCLASLLRITCLLGFEESKPDDTLLIIPKPHPFMLEMMDVEATLQRLASILNDEAHHHSILQIQYRTGFWGRAQVVQFAMNILVSFVHASKEARSMLWSNPDVSSWLQKLILDDPEPAVRREICAGLYRICLGNAKTYHELMAPLLQKLVSFLPIAEKMTSQNNQHHLTADDGKEPYGPACRDYFWLLARLVDTLTPEMVKESLDEPQSGAIDIEGLCIRLSQSILERDFYETRHGCQDDGLVGLINLMANLVKYDPPFKYSVEAMAFIHSLFDCLFDLPTPQNRQAPKCKSQTSRAAAYDLLVELCRNCACNYALLHRKLLNQHRPGPHAPYPWDYWPRDDVRSECGFVGLTNLGATCYMASCIQHLYMMPQAREAVLSVPPEGAQKHGTTLHELQRMFAYLLESERKSYNPRSFCRVYQMDHQPLNTGEQKDMAEFFIDLVSKLEEMTPDLKKLVKRLFCGTLSNNVVSLDCGHVSRTAEEFYTVRCQVADMRNLQESLDEVTVKDTLEGDNMYTCSQCGRKVRAEKRACFKKLPQILCFNTMRYTFNMVTMLKEKVNTHFSFPMRLDMSNYVEKTLMPHQYLEEKQKRERKNSVRTNNSECDGNQSSSKSSIQTSSSSSESKMDVDDIGENVGGDQSPVESADDNEEEDEFSEYYEYDLVGVTVHTGTADGGHYYSFIKERNEQNSQQERWFLFNDAEVKPFDPSQIGAECFGGEMTSKTYDSVTEKYLDFSFEKTNSAYMLFYERRVQRNDTNENAVAGGSKPAYQSICNKVESSPAQEVGKLQLEDSSVAAVSTAESKASTSASANHAVVVQKLQQQINSSTTIQNETDSSSSSSPVNSNLVGFNNANKICDIDVKSNNAMKTTSASPSSSSSCSSASNVISHTSQQQPSPSVATSPPSSKAPGTGSTSSGSSIAEYKTLLSKELEEWIWQDNQHFLQDKNIFEHTYFNFMWQICGQIPQTLLTQSDVTCMVAELSVSFFIETFIHAKEKPTMVLWVELLTKQFNASQTACEWFLGHMSTEPWWPVQVLIQCPNQMVRQMFQRLVIHVIQRLRPTHYSLYLQTESSEDGKEEIGNCSCVTRFIKSLILLLEHGAKAHLRHLSEFFGLLYEFSRMGDEETLFLLRINVIRSVSDFYLGNKNQDSVDAGSDNEDNSSDEALSADKARPASLDKMIALVASLVERSRGPDFRLHLSPKDYSAVAGGKGFPFLYQQIKDNINPHQTRHLIYALCRWDERLANQIITMLFASVTKHTELCGPFFKLLTLLTEPQGGPSGLPCFSQLVLQRVWDAAEYCPQSALDWLAVQAPRNKIAHAWILQSAESWVEQFLMAHNNSRVRNAASYLLVSLVPSQSFRANYRAHSLHKLPFNIPHRELNGDAQIILHTILNLLLRLLRSARAYTDIAVHGTAKLTSYFTLLTYCMVSKTEKLMLGPYMRVLWELFHPRLSEPSVPAHHNKHALLAFWYHATNDCPENAQLIANCPDITRNIAFNYILADHDDSDIVAYNRAMLPAYYGLLRICCQQSRTLTRQLAAHQNLQWAFKNITPHPTQYPLAVDELFRLMTLFAARHPDASEQEQREVSSFRRTTLSAYLTGLDARVSWSTLIAALRILVDNDEDRLFVVYNGGIEMCFDALHTLHSMYHEATACHVSGDLQELLTELVLLVGTLRLSSRIDQKKRAQATSSTAGPNAPPIKGLNEAVKRLATLLNTYNPPEMRNLTLDVLKEIVRNPDLDVTNILVPLFTNCHLSAQNAPNSIGPLGPYFPRSGTKAPWPSLSKSAPRPPRPMVQMAIPQGQILQKGIDKEYDMHLEALYKPYHDFLDIMMRMAVNTNQLNESLVKLSCLAAIEAAPLHFNLFPKFWVGIHNTASTNKYTELLVNNPNLIEYVDILLRDERISLNDPVIRSFVEIYYPKITSGLAISRLIYSISYKLQSKEDSDELCGDLHAIRVIAQATGVPTSVRTQLRAALKAALAKNREEIKDKDEMPPNKRIKITPPEQQKQQQIDNQTATASTQDTSPTTSEKYSIASSHMSNDSIVGTKSKPHDESNDADDENEDDEMDVDGKADEAKKSAENKLAEEREKEKCYLKTIESYIEAILDLIQDDDMEEDSNDNSNQLIKPTSSNTPPPVNVPPPPSSSDQPQVNQQQSASPESTSNTVPNPDKPQQNDA
ncbi:ubiquitin carboxyl-terminal hydrolase puf isoform X3 [Hermetia illucens]|uniref:ubiquitin carboxyl-terminal hydrolase puf isoform X3 n=1 Tax=Hermetia illucens TaxID=343691 RepID=UPI0018CC25D3|nr:ubiquitin carboxyl-terminal hydrolase puf isoform X3 [Hermetia illucens]